MRDKAALVIVDDVWRAEDVEPFLAESRCSRLLLTTRHASIAAAVGACWSHVSNLLRGADPARIKAQFPGYPHADLLRALQVSADALETAEHFLSLSLAQRNAESGGIRLHDLQLDYVRAQCPDREALDLIHGAVRLSSSVIERDPRQFALQIVGRLLPHRDSPAVQQFAGDLAAAAPAPWLRPLHPALHPPRTELVRTPRLRVC